MTKYRSVHASQVPQQAAGKLLCGGLSTTVAKARLRRSGMNVLPTSEARSVLAIAWQIACEPMFLLLLGAGTIYLLLGDVSDALMLLGFVIVVMTMTIYQENKTERVLEALRDLSSPRALVRRDGLDRRIAGREVVPGDLLILAEGDRVPADAILTTCHHMAMDESLLTGESVAVSKVSHAASFDKTDPSTAPPPGGDGTSFIYSGALVVKGHGEAVVIATGLNTQIGKIGKALQSVTQETTPLQKEIRQLVRNLALLGVLLSVLLFVIEGITRGNWLDGLLSGITLAMSILPEEYPVVLSIFMAMGAWRMSKHRVLTRRAHTIEALGAATVMCVDKTGTLTFNQMAVQQLRVNDAVFMCNPPTQAMPEMFHALAEFALLASDIVPTDPMDKAIHTLANQYLSETEHLHGEWQLVHEYALSPQLMALSHGWKAMEHNAYIVAAKGAPEAIAALCHLNDAQHAQLTQQVHEIAAQGLRVLAVANAQWHEHVWPDNQHDLSFTLLGLIGLADPVRPTVKPAIQQCHAAGIRVMMITGDYPVTAAAIAAQIGLAVGDGGIMTGDALSQMDEATLRAQIGQSNIFARMQPAQKLRLVNALKANGEIVAMTGDGVNDAPALKAAHIGIAMGGRGTDVAREASAMVLLDDDFAAIVHAVRLGRCIFDNLRQGMAYIFAVHLPIIGLALLPLLLGWPPVFAPVHIVFLEMIINPASSIVFEAEPAEASVMQRPPRAANEALFGRQMFLLCLLQGLLILCASMAVLAYALHQGLSNPLASAMTFTTLVIGNVGLILVNRSWHHSMMATLRKHNPALWWVIGGALTFLLLALHVPFLRAVFHFAPMSASEFLVCIAAGLVGVSCVEVMKLLRESHNRWWRI